MSFLVCNALRHLLACTQSGELYVWCVGCNHPFSSHWLFLCPLSFVSRDVPGETSTLHCSVQALRARKTEQDADVRIGAYCSAAPAFDRLLTLHIAEAVRLMEGGVPVVTLSTRHSFFYSERMRVWMRATDTAFLQSEFLSVVPLVQQAGMEPRKHALPLQELQVPPNSLSLACARYN